MKVLHFITDFRRGGESSILSAFLPWSAGKGVENRVVFLTENTDGLSSDSLVPLLEKSGIPYLDLKIRKATDLWRLVYLYKEIETFRPDVLHTYLFHPNILGRCFKLFFPWLKTVSSTVGTDVTWKKPWHSALERMTSYFADCILVNARAIREVLISRDRIQPRLIKLLYNGVDLSRFKTPAGAPSTDFTVGFVGRLHAEKDPISLVNAFYLFQKKVPQAKLLLVGEGKERDAITERARELGILGNVSMPGTVSDGIENYYSSMSVLAISSEYEGIPGVLFEAMYLGVPVVSYPVGGIAEIFNLTTPPCGLLTSKRSPEELSDLLFQVFSNPEERKQMAKRAKQLVDSQFTSEKNFQERVRLYQTLIGSKERNFASTGNAFLRTSE